MHRTISDWRKVKPTAVASGSEAQCANVLGMAIDDLDQLGRTLTAIMEAAERNDADACHELARKALNECDLMQSIRHR